jgi:hypothetical protein
VSGGRAVYSIARRTQQNSPLPLLQSSGKGVLERDSSRISSFERVCTHLDIVHGKRARSDVGSRSQGVVDPQRHGPGQLVVVKDAPVLIMILHNVGKMLDRILYSDG